jgi:hypothetical protein
MGKKKLIKSLPWFLLGITLIILTIQTVKGCNNKYIENPAEQGIKTMQLKLDSISKSLDQKKDIIRDTLIMQKNNEKTIVKQLQDINNYYENKQDTIIFMPVTDTLARRKVDEWVRGDEKGYYNIPK